MAHSKSNKLLVSLSVLVLVSGLVFITKASESSDSTVRLPGTATTNDSNTVRSIESGAMNFSEGIELSSSEPTGSPNDSVQPVPQFSGLNVPWWVNETGPVEIPDDTILHGLVDVRLGLVNNGAGAGIIPGTPPVARNISLSSDATFPTPASASVARGTVGHIATRLTLKAPLTGGMNISRIIVTRAGTSQDNHLANVKIFEEVASGSATQLGATVVSLSSGKATFALNPAWAIPANTTKILRISTDVTAAAAQGATFQLGIAAAADVTSSVALRGSFPMNGNSFTVGAPARLVTIGYEASGVSGGSIAAGTNGATFSKFNFNATGTDDVLITGITVGKSGFGANTDVKNVKLYDGTTQLGGTVAALSASGDATFSNLNLVVAKGSSKVVTLKGDVAAAAGIGNTFSFGINAASSIQGSSGTTVEFSSGSSTVGEAEFTIVAAPPILTVTRSPKPAANSTLAAGAGKAILEMDATLSSGTKRLSKVYVTPFITGNPAANSMGNYRLERKDSTGVWRLLQTAAPESMMLKASDPSSIVLSFSIVNNAYADISTSTVKLRLTADIACVASAASIDFVVANDNHLFFTTAYPTVSRNISSVAQQFPICIALAPDEGSSFTASVLGSGIFPEASETNVFSELFGVQQAKALTLIEMVPIFGAFSDKVLKHPVTVYDDLYIQGAGNTDEPGDLIINGAIYSGGFRGNAALNVLPIYSSIFTTEGLWVLGETELADLTVSDKLKVYNGVDVLTGNLTVPVGSVTANSIGAYYRMDNYVDSSVVGDVSTAVSCSASDILISCNGMFTNTQNTGFTGSTMANKTCTARGRVYNAAGQRLNVQGVCFNPDNGTRPNSGGSLTVTPL